MAPQPEGYLAAENRSHRNTINHPVGDLFATRKNQRERTRGLGAKKSLDRKTPYVHPSKITGNNDKESYPEIGVAWGFGGRFIKEKEYP